MGVEAGENELGRSVMRQVTLVTGDRVLVLSPGGAPVKVVPGRGRAKARFRVISRGGHHYLIPGDAERLLGQGLLDRRLFDLTQLVARGYDDARRRDVPLIIKSSRGESAPALDADAVRVDKSRTGAFWSRLVPRGARSLAGGVTRIWLDTSVPQVHAPQANPIRSTSAEMPPVVDVPISLPPW